MLEPGRVVGNSLRRSARGKSVTSRLNWLMGIDDGQVVVHASLLELSSRCLSPGSSAPHAPATVVGWIPGTSPGMTKKLDIKQLWDHRHG
jgi:hypothetical protein